MKIFLHFIIVLFLCFFAQAIQQPNVIIVITDDQGYPNLSCTGHPLLETPHIDHLYSNGVRLTNFHVDPTCAPTRAALMTGRYSARAGVWHTVMGRNLLRQREVTMADVFSHAGYRTGHFGKWHLGDVYPYRPEDRGFQEVLVTGAGGVGQTPGFWGNDYFDDTYRVNKRFVSFKGFCTDIFFNQAMKFIQNSVKRKQPFFAYITLNAPHGPFYAPEKYKERIQKKSKQQNLSLHENTIGYYGMIENIDDNMGILQQFLKDNNLEENTILIFTSDNGPVIRQSIELFNAGLRGGKTSYYDGGHRVPWFMRWPAGGLDQPVDINNVTAHIDILPTLIDLCGLKKPDIQFDGMSLKPLLDNPSSEWVDRSLIVENQRVVDPLKYRNFAVMTDQWRLTGQQTKDDRSLNNMSNDRAQKKDVAKKYFDVFNRLEKEYESFWQDVSREHDLVSRIKVGSIYQNPICLTAHDWLGSTLWNQTHIIDPSTSKYGPPCGFWAVDVEEDGWYQISLRRWPAESDRAINDSYVGVSYDVTKVKLTIQDQVYEKDIPIDAKEVTFRVKLKKGEAKLDSLFLGGKESISPFYAYILHEKVRVPTDWQTREGLGLPLAIWPDVHGKDPTVY